jgi:LuxR family maltose regulon positive regulatory protein
VLSRRGSAQILRTLATANLPIVAMDRNGEWYRHNGLLRDLLAAELREGSPDEEAVLHCRASEWWQAQGDVEAAVCHARKAGAIDRADGLVGAALPRCASSDALPPTGFSTASRSIRSDRLRTWLPPGHGRR